MSHYSEVQHSMSGNLEQADKKVCMLKLHTVNREIFM